MHFSGFNRRRFLQLGVAGFATFSARSFASFAQGPDAFSRNGNVAPATHPFKNRGPLAASAFCPLPLGSIKPTGWLRSQLRIQANGLSGHLGETWPDAGPNSGWLGGTGESWERGPYYMDGLVPLAYQLEDARLKAIAQKFVDWTLDSQQPSGMFGPKSNDDWWPRMVMLKVLTQYQEATGDPRVVPFMSRYFAHQLKALPSRPLRDWGRYRWQDEALSVLWLYNRTGGSGLLDLAKLLHQQGYDWQAQFADFKYTRRVTPQSIGLTPKSKLTDAGMQTHGVNNAMAIKMSPVWSLLSGSETDRRAVLRMIAELDRYHGLPNGMFSADEHFAGRNPSQGTELCTVVETMFSLEQSLAILGDPSLGDRLERIAFNALPGTFTDDMWAHQYDQEPNQIIVSLHNKPWTTNGPESNLYGLDPNFGCCTANYHQGWPKFVSSLFMLSANDGLVAAAYAPCEVTTNIRNTDVHVLEETDYPFRGTIRLTVNPASPVSFPLLLRIPGWASGASIRVNSRPQPAPQPGSFARVERTWNPDDTVQIDFPLTPRASRWFNDSLALERGPLVFSYGIGEDWLKLRDRGMTADWQVYPTTPWNYVLDVRPESIAQDVSVTESAVGEGPFTKKGAPVTLHAKARRLPTWLGVDGAADPVPQSPVASQEAEETVALVPYAAAKLRITAFPQLKT
ncbi:MAG TPA: beta-L-arabinofuranosidase domain-containing protein [Acidobacteriaceae bacterium]|nr:beta-L-arabinofuranosidase domain-containing protein [Acidobacteriaceae bacterium]